MLSKRWVCPFRLLRNYLVALIACKRQHGRERRLGFQFPAPKQARMVGTIPNAACDRMLEMWPQAGVNFDIGRGAHPTAPEDGRAPRDAEVTAATRVLSDRIAAAAGKAHALHVMASNRYRFIILFFIF